MTRIIRAAIAAFVVIAVVAPVAQAKKVTTPVTIKNFVHLSKDGKVLNGDGTLNKVGKFTAAGDFALPNTDWVWTFGDGSTLQIHVAGNLDSTGHPIGDWTVTGGTGQFAGAEGSGKMHHVEVLGKDPAHQVYTGKITTRKKLVKAKAPSGWTATPDTTA